MLHRVKVMRVFDLAGLVEAVGEIGEICESALGDTRAMTHGGANEKRIAVADSEEEFEGETHSDCSEGDSGQRRLQEELSGSKGSHESQIGMAVVDTITNTIGSIMAKSHVQGDMRPFLQRFSYVDEANSAEICTDTDFSKDKHCLQV